ncbi:MAG TPA: type ISP restriction/modification enzyme [Longimicrobiales bacterium]|nr:type ISP restriction/modification enzyme [Longimicrobiales bacterium]
MPELFPVSFPGVKTSRDDLVVDIDRDRLVQRMQDYFNPKLSHEDIRRRMPTAMTSTTGFQAEAVRNRLLTRGFLPDKIIRYCYRPFDVRWLYWEPETGLLDRKRGEYFPHVRGGNLWLSSGQRNRMESFYQPQFTTLLADHHTVESNVGMFPAYLYSDDGSLLEAAGHKPNLTEIAAAYLAQLSAAPEDLFFHTLAVLHAPAYRVGNAGPLRQDWPRVPLPGSRELLQASATLGRQVAALLDVETSVPGVTTGKIRDELKRIAVFVRVDDKPAHPEAGDLDVTAGWGHAGKGGVTMPGTGKITDRGDVVDIHLNDIACWRNVPKAVWEYTIGGYQVIKKWLSYRENKLLGRGLTPDEARYVTEIARRMAALVALQPNLDQNYGTVTSTTYLHASQ